MQKFWILEVWVNRNSCDYRSRFYSCENLLGIQCHVITGSRTEKDINVSSSSWIISAFNLYLPLNERCLLLLLMVFTSLHILRHSRHTRSRFTVSTAFENETTVSCVLSLSIYEHLMSDCVLGVDFFMRVTDYACTTMSCLSNQICLITHSHLTVGTCISIHDINNDSSFSYLMIDMIYIVRNISCIYMNILLFF